MPFIALAKGCKVIYHFGKVYSIELTTTKCIKPKKIDTSISNSLGVIYTVKTLSAYNYFIEND